MNIAFVINALNHGGAERQTVNLAHALSVIPGNKVFLLTEKKRTDEYPLSNDVIREEILTGSLLIDALKIQRCVCNFDIDIIIGMGIYPNWVVCLSRFLHKCKVIVAEMNDPLHDNISKKSRLLRRALYWKADGYVFQTKEERDFYTKNIRLKATVIPNPMCSQLPSRTSVASKNIVAVGRLMAQKNYPLLLKSFAIVVQKHPDYELHIYGKGAELNMLETLASDLNIRSKVFFEGFCNNVHREIADSDIYVMSSDFEGMPNALMEAMGMGFPVVCTNCGGGGPKALIVHGINGMLTPVGDEKKMAENISYLIENPQFKEQLGKEAMKINDTHSLSAIGKMWQDYCSLVYFRN